RAAFTVSLGFLAIEGVGTIEVLVLRERGRRRRDQRDALVGRPKQHVECDPGTGGGPRVMAAEHGDRAGGVEEPGVKEIRAHASRLEREFAEPEHAELETQANEIGLLHAATLYCATMRILTLN